VKFEQENRKFRPMTITLETADEAQALIDILGGVTGAQGDSLAYKIYTAIDKAGFDYDPNAYTGSRRRNTEDDD